MAGSRQGNPLKIVCLFIALLLPALGTSECSAHADRPIGSVYGMVVSTSDGNHLTVDNNGTEIVVRLHCIDAPVITKVHRNQPWLSRPGQPFAGKAFMALSNKVLHKQVRLDILKIDHRQEAIAVVYLDGRNINFEMVAEGWAWADPKCKKRPADSDYVAAEELARAKKLGIWSQDKPLPPWEFRKLLKQDRREN